VVIEMMVTLSDVLDDLRNAEHALRAFEQRYWLSSEVFYELYSQGLLDNGDSSEEFAEWAGQYLLKQKRETALQHFSRQRIARLRCETDDETSIHLSPQEPVLEFA
jgi:hypothetical protein